MSNDFLTGLGVALVSPFNYDLSLDFVTLGKLIEHVIRGGCDYIVALGTTAETPTLSAQEKNDVTAFIKDKVGDRVPLVMGIGGNNTSAVVKDITTRNLDGYSAILSVAPYYNKPSQEGLFQHFKAICDESPLPVILYNVPGRTGVNLTSDTTLRLAGYSNKIIAIKEASGNFEQCAKIIKEAPKSFMLISGDDSNITPLMKMGAVGVISVLANALPKATKELVTLCDKKEFDLAEKLQNSFKTLIGHLFEEGNPCGIKALLSRIGLGENILRLPLVPVSTYLEEKIKLTSSPFL